MTRRLPVLGLLVCAVLALLTAPAAARQDAEVTVLSFNIHHAAGTDDVLDVDRIARAIEATEADVIGLQEVDRHYSERSEWADQPRELAKRLGYHVVFGANIDRDPPEGSDDRIQYGTAILSRYPIVDWDNTYLFRSPDQEQRGLLHAELNVRGRSFHVYNTHLAASSQTDRLEQTRQLVELIGDTTPGVLVGDMNALPDAPEIEPLDAAFTDAWKVAGTGPGSTYPAEEPAKRIDYLFATDGVEPKGAWVEPADPVASDHLPLAGEFELPGPDA